MGVKYYRIFCKRTNISECALKGQFILDILLIIRRKLRKNLLNIRAISKILHSVYFQKYEFTRFPWSPICSSDIATNCPFSRETLDDPGKQAQHP